MQIQIIIVLYVYNIKKYGLFLYKKGKKIYKKQKFTVIFDQNSQNPLVRLFFEQYVNIF